MDNRLQAFSRLLDIMDELREKCPWDKKQTMESLRHLTIEETYELGDAILDKDLNNIKKELGDVLLHIVFYAKIASETNDFNIRRLVVDTGKDSYLRQDDSMIFLSFSSDIAKLTTGPDRLTALHSGL